jgi:alpha-tubulin suppressor-like RCC1 family protein
MLQRGSVGSSLGLHTLCISPDGQVYGFGFNSAGQAGVSFFCSATFLVLPPLLQASGKEAVLRPELLAVASEAVVETAVGAEHSLARTASGRVYSWGANESGQLGLGHTRRPDKPTLVDLGGREATAVACGSRFSVAAVAGGDVYCWGAGCEGVGQSSRPVRVPLAVREGDEVVRIACGHGHALALTRQGRVVGWGRNANGQLGGEEGEISLFDGANNRAAAVACGAEHSFVMSELGRLWGFGSNLFGQLGLGSDRSPRREPEEVTHFADAEGVLIAGVACGAHHTAVLTDDGRVYAMGWNEYGQLGIAASSKADIAAIEDAGERWLAIGAARKEKETRLLPALIDGLERETIVAVECGREHTLALAASGRVFGWGYNGLGQLGLGSRVDQPVPLAWPGEGPKLALLGSVLVAPDLKAAVRRQALYLQQQTRQLERQRAELPTLPLLRTSRSGTAGGGNLGGKRRKGSVPARQLPHCPACDKPLKKSIHFCVHCGHKVEERDSAQTKSAPGSPVVSLPEPGTPENLSAIEEEEEEPAVTSAVSAPASIIPAALAAKAEKAGKRDSIKSKPVTLFVTPSRASGSGTLPKMSSLQKAMVDMPSPMPMPRPGADADERRSSLDSVESAKLVSLRLSGRETSSAAATTPVAKLCARCGQALHLDDKAKGPDGKAYHIRCLK